MRTILLALCLALAGCQSATKEPIEVTISNNEQWYWNVEKDRLVIIKLKVYRGYRWECYKDDGSTVSLATRVVPPDNIPGDHEYDVFYVKLNRRVSMPIFRLYSNDEDCTHCKQFCATFSIR